MSSGPLLERVSEVVNNADIGCCSDTRHPSVDNCDATDSYLFDIGEGLIPVGCTERHPWATLASLKHDVEEDSLIGGSPRHADSDEFSYTCLSGRTHILFNLARHRETS